MKPVVQEDVTGCGIASVAALAGALFWTNADSEPSGPGLVAAGVAAGPGAGERLPPPPR